MKKEQFTNKVSYEAPEVFQVTVSVEQGFAGSIEGGGEGGDI